MVPKRLISGHIMTYKRKYLQNERSYRQTKTLY